MNLKYVASQSDHTAIMQVYRPIGGDKGINGADFADQVLYLENAGYKTLNVRTNCLGGSLVDGFSMFSALRDCSKRGNCTVNIYVDFLAASMGGVLALAVPIENRFIASNALFMMHNVHGPKATAQEKMIMGKMKASIMEVLVPNMGQDEAKVSELMNKETWMNAEEAVEAGLFLKANVFSAVIEDPKLITNQSPLELYEYSNSILNHNEKDMQELENLKKEKLELENKLAALTLENKKKSDEATDKDAELEEEKKATTKLAEEKKALEDKLAEKAKEEKEKNDLEATNFVDAAIKNGLIDKKFRDENLKAAKNDFASYKNVVGSFKGHASASFTAYAGSKEEKADKKDMNDRENWSCRDWEKKDPAGLQNMIDNDNEKYQALYNETYKK
jgi:ATP-dependent Clp protease, protease subunit